MGERELKDAPGLREKLANIEYARRLSDTNESVRIVALVSGTEEDRRNWERVFTAANACLFNSDGSTRVLSLREKIGRKTRAGNMLGTLLAYRYIKKAFIRKKPSYRDHVILLGMLFGRGERMSPVTQSQGDRKSAIIVSPGGAKNVCRKRGYTAIEEALVYFTPVARYFEAGGFRGILDKWGDETEIASVDLTRPPAEGSFSEYDVIKIISVVEITEDLAKQKDWVVFDESGSMIAQLSRNERDILVGQLKALGISPREDDKFYAGVSLGPVAVSYDVLDIAEKVFGTEIKKPGVYFDLDPYFFMALAMGDDPAAWDEAVAGDRELALLAGKDGMVPDFFRKVQKIKRLFREKHGRELNLKVFDLGAEVYWADIGQHSAMRHKFMAFNDGAANGIVARKISGLPDERDGRGNIVVNSDIDPGVTVTDSVLVNAVITGTGEISNSVILDSRINAPFIKEAFAVRSVRLGPTSLAPRSGIYESLGAEGLALEAGERHVSILTSKGKKDLKVAEETNLRDKNNTYNVPILGNEISFDEAYDEMFGVSREELERRRTAAMKDLERIEEMSARFKPLRFGTSGLRDKVENLTDLEVYINTRGFIGFLRERGELPAGERPVIALGGDLRPSTPGIMASVARAIADEGCEPDVTGMVPSPVLAYHALRNGIPSVMVTGSHIPADRNGIKFTKTSGEVLKTDEADILRNVAQARNEEYARSAERSLFTEKGAFKKEAELPGAPGQENAIREYVERYTGVFPEDALKGGKYVIYQHSAVGRDILPEIFEGLGAETVRVARSDEFVPVDTEKVSEKTKEILRRAAEQHKPDAIFSLDGDSDRPLLADGNGKFLPGDKLGALVAMYLRPDFAAVPVSANPAVVKGLRAEGIQVRQTRIGSPYVIAAMNAKLAEDPGAKVVSWESNGGFLTGSDWEIEGKTLKALPTRDAALPLLSAALLAKKENMTMSELISKKLPPFYTAAGVVDNTSKGAEDYSPAMGKEIVAMFSPSDKNVESVTFDDGEVEAVEGADLTPELEKELVSIKDKLGRYFGEEKGLGEIVGINFVDGIRMSFLRGGKEEISHIRPSGNAPEFRNYAAAETEKRAEEIAGLRYKIIPEIIKDMS